VDVEKSKKRGFRNDIGIRENWAQNLYATSILDASSITKKIF
jgi:hypothetical protein